MRRSTVLLVGAALAAGCKSNADELVLEAVDDLKACDIRSAHDKFADAWADDRDHPQAALGFALTDLALLPEDPIVTNMLTRFGFTRGIDMQALAFGPDGLLARAARGETCEQIEAHTDANLPYPPLADPNLDEVALIDPALTGTDIAGAAMDLTPRLVAIAEALEVAAAGMTEPVEVEGGCGLGKVRLQAPELYAGAALIRLVVAAIDLGQAYDWELALRATFEAERAGDPVAYAALLNAHLGRVIDPSGSPTAKAMTAKAIDLVLIAIDSAKAAASVPDQLFDWTAFPDALLDDIRRLAASIRGALDGPTALADVTPEVTVDASTMFTSPIDLQTGPEPLFLVEGVAPDQWVSMNGAAVDHAIESMIAPNPVPSLMWAPQPAWDAFDAAPVTMPAERFETIYTCMSAPPPPP
jgi:hypothetical protein